MKTKMFLFVNLAIISELAVMKHVYADFNESPDTNISDEKYLLVKIDVSIVRRSCYSTILES